MTEVDKPIDKFVQGRLDDNYHTMDMPLLFQRYWHPLFVYGSLKAGLSRNKVLEGCPLIGSGWTRNTGYVMYATINPKQMLNYPMIFPCNQEVPGSVFGEVYLVPPSVIKYVDMIEGNGILYNREKRTIDLYSRKGTNHTMAVWMYLSHRSIWKDRLEKNTVKLCELFKRDSDGFKYYLFKKDDECPVVQSATTPPTKVPVLS